MIRHFDHPVIAVRDLDRAIATYREALGLDARYGGRHAGRGSHNAIIRFGLDYVELQGIHDPEAELRAVGKRGEVFLDFLAKREGGLIGYSLAPEAVDEYVERFSRTGLEATGTLAVQRRVPDGRLLSWRVLIPGGVNWRRPWPFFVRADQGDEERLAIEPPGSHPLGATGIAGVAVAVRDLERGKDLYERQIGFLRSGEDTIPELAVSRVRYLVASSRIDILAPTGPGPVQQELDAVGEGTFELTLRVQSLERARAYLARSGISLTPAPGSAAGWLIPPERAWGARIVLEESA